MAQIPRERIVAVAGGLAEPIRAEICTRFSACSFKVAGDVLIGVVSFWCLLAVIFIVYLRIRNTRGRE